MKYFLKLYKKAIINIRAKVSEIEKKWKINKTIYF